MDRIELLEKEYELKIKNNPQISKERKEQDYAALQTIKLIDTLVKAVTPKHNYPIRKITPNENTYGYRWVQDKKGDIFIVKIKILDKFWLDNEVFNMLDFVTEKCTIIEIKNIKSGAVIDEIEEPVAYWRGNIDSYKVGMTIIEKTWFCLSELALFASQGQKINRMAKCQLIHIPNI